MIREVPEKIHVISNYITGKKVIKAKERRETDDKLILCVLIFDQEAIIIQDFFKCA